MNFIGKIKNKVFANKLVPDEMKFGLNLPGEISKGKTKLAEKILKGEYSDNPEQLRKDIESIGLDLSYVNLDFVDLSNLDFSHVNLTGSSLISTNFTQTNLKGSILMACDISSANFFSTDLSNSNITMVSGSGVKFTSTKMDMANCRGSNFSGSDFSSATLMGADLSDCNLSNCNISSSCGACFENSNVSGTCLEGTETKGLKLYAETSASLSRGGLSIYARQTTEGVFVSIYSALSNVYQNATGKRYAENRNYSK